MLLRNQKILDLLRTILSAIIVFLCLIPLSCFILANLLYRGLASILLRIEYGDKYAGLLKNHDALWGVEEDSSLSVANSLILYEHQRKEKLDSESNSESLYNILKAKVQSWLLQPTLAKMFQQRKVKYGYNYLVNIPRDSVQLQDYIRLVDVPAKDTYLTEPELQKWIADQYTMRLPQDHANFFEMIVSRRPTRGFKGETLYPVIIDE